MSSLLPAVSGEASTSPKWQWLLDTTVITVLIVRLITALIIALMITFGYLPLAAQTSP
jgi:hypothetical protein